MGLFVGVVASVGSMFVADRIGTEPDTAEPVRSALPDPPPSIVSSDDVDATRRNAIVQAVERVSPAVVTISVTQLRRERVVTPFNDPMWQFFFPDLGREFIRKVNSMGSGFIVSEDGLIVTNEHVIRGASEIVVNLPDGRSFTGEIFGEPDAQTDLAIIKIEGDDLPVAPLGRSDDLMIGEWAIAIGNPFGYLIRDAHPTVTVGVISALNRDFDASTANDRSYRDMIQTDASINPGNSGGPLVNSEGYVIGVNTFIFSQSGGSQGIGFAIPVRRVRMIIDDILRYG
jgi:serine protease Do